MKTFRCIAPAALVSVLSLISLIHVAHAQAAADAMPYQPRPVTVPKDAPYVLPDGSIYIVGVDSMEDVLKEFNALFVKTHPGFKFKMKLANSSTVGIGGLAANVSAFAPMGREAWPSEVTSFRNNFGYVPTAIRIGYDGFGPRPKRKSPPGIYVNAKNPLAGLTVEQITRIFTSGSPKGDITRWEQLGLKGEWALRAIHVYGPRDDGGVATSKRLTHMNKLPFASHYEALPRSAPLDAVAADPFGIALLSFIDPAPRAAEVRMLPLAAKEGESFADASYESVAAGRYPYEPYMHLYVNRAPGKPLDPFVKEYLRMALSREGQAIIAAHTDSDEGYVPLTAREAAEELAKLE